jgi:hypothetical protein
MPRGFAEIYSTLSKIELLSRIEEMLSLDKYFWLSA